MSFLCCVESGGSLVTCSTAHGGGNSIQRHRLSEREGGWSFQTTSCPSPPLSGRVVALETALDRSRGLTLQFLVSQKTSSDLLEVYSLAPSPSDSFTSHGTLEVAYGGLEKNLTVLDGPTLVWGQEDRVCVALPEAKTGGRSGFFSKRSIPLSGYISGSVERLWAFGCPNDSLLLLVRCSSSGRCVREPNWCCLSVDVGREKQEGGGKEEGLGVQLVPSHRCVPEDYGCIATCLSVGQFWGVGGEGEVWSDTQFLVGTSYRQLVLLRGGIPFHCVSMETTSISLQVLQMSGDEMVVAVKCGSGRVNGYRMTVWGEREVREESESWDGVAHTAVGDFANRNRQQLLLLLTGDDGDFIVTDFCGFTATGNQGGVGGGVAKSEVAQSLTSAVGALKKRQQEGEAHLMDLERQLQQKTHLLREGLQTLVSLCKTTSHPHPSPPHRDQSLVCILPGKMEKKVDDVKVGVANDVGPAHTGPVVTECWQRLLDGSWVVGVVLKNNTDSVWSEVGLGLRVDGLSVVEGGGSRLVWTSYPQGGGSSATSCEEGGPPASKRAKKEGVELLEGALKQAGVGKMAGWLGQQSVLHGGLVCLVSWVPLPSAVEWNQLPGVLTAGLVVTWGRRGSGGKGEGVRAVEVGRVELPWQHLANRDLQCDGEEGVRMWGGGEGVGGGGDRDFSGRALQDLACLLATQNITQLKLHSRYSDLTCLADTLRKRMPLSSGCILPRPHSIPPENGNGNLEHGPLGHVFLHVSSQKHTATVAILYKSPPCLPLVMSAIQNCLPDDVILSHPHFSPSSHPHSSPSSHITGEQIQAIRQSVAAMRRELRERVRRESGEEEEVVAEEETDFAMFRAMQALGL